MKEITTGKLSSVLRWMAENGNEAMLCTFELDCLGLAADRLEGLDSTLADAKKTLCQLCRQIDEQAGREPVCAADCKWRE